MASMSEITLRIRVDESFFSHFKVSVDVITKSANPDQKVHAPFGLGPRSSNKCHIIPFCGGPICIIDWS